MVSRAQRVDMVAARLMREVIDAERVGGGVRNKRNKDGVISIGSMYRNKDGVISIGSMYIRKKRKKYLICNHRDNS
jgi:hypothetical protein